MKPSPRIALIDDDRTWLETLAEYLRDKGYGVETALGGARGLRLLERAAFYQELGEKKLRPVVQNGSGAPGNAPTRIEVNAVTGGRYAYGAYPDIDGLFSEQANEVNPRVRQQLLVKIQQMIHERVMFGPMDAHTLELLEFHKIRELVGGYAFCSLGKDLALQAEPSTNADAIRAELALVREMAEVLGQA